MNPIFDGKTARIAVQVCDKVIMTEARLKILVVNGLMRLFSKAVRCYRQPAACSFELFPHVYKRLHPGIIERKKKTIMFVFFLLLSVRL